jgi:hypothetical protein
MTNDYNIKPFNLKTFSHAFKLRCFEPNFSRYFLVGFVAFWQPGVQLRSKWR